MGAICNGPPKAGTNALRAVVCRLGFRRMAGGLLETTGFAGRDAAGRRIPESWDATLRRLGRRGAIGAHRPGVTAPSPHRVVTILRDPRNIAVSTYRAQRPACSFAAFVTGARGFYSRCAAFFAGPAPEPTVRYETLFAPETVRRIADHLGVPARDAAPAYGRSPTWSGAPSDWRAWFDPALEAAFWRRWNAALKGEAI